MLRSNAGIIAVLFLSKYYLLVPQYGQAAKSGCNSLLQLLHVFDVFKDAEQYGQTAKSDDTSLLQLGQVGAVATGCGVGVGTG